MKVQIIKDERYPDYGLYIPDSWSSDVIEVEQELYTRYRTAAAEYGAVQDLLEALYDKLLGDSK